MNVPISIEELEWIKMALEEKVTNLSNDLDWYNSQCQWDMADKTRAVIKTYNDILAKLGTV